MLRIIDKYLLKKYLLNFLLGTLGSTVIFFAFDFFSIVEKVTTGELAFGSIPLAALQAIPAIISYEMMHLASLMAALLTMHDLSSHLEIVALKTSGISFIRIIRAPLIAATCISFGLLFFTEFVSVVTFKNKNAMLGGITDTSISRSAVDLYYKGGNNFFRFGIIDGYSNRAKNLQIVTVDNENVIRVINAPYAVYDKAKNKWILDNAVINDVQNNKVETVPKYVLDVKETIDDFLNYRIISIRDKVDKYGFSKQLTYKEINKNIKFLEKAGGNYRRLLTHVYHQRVAVPFSVVVMTLIGFALLSKFSRAGVGSSIIYGIALGFAYYVLLDIAKAMGIGEVVPIIVSAWLPNSIFALLGLYLLSQADG